MNKGGCECKSVRYQFTGEPLTCYACHCTDCQTSSGSAFSLSMIINSSDIEVTEGELTVNYLNVNGVEVKRHHCAKCGAALWFSAAEYPNIYALKPGTFDDTKWFKPVAHLWIRSAQPCVIFDKNTKQYQKQPEEMSELFELWAKREYA